MAVNFNREHAQFQTVSIPVSTGKGDDKRQTTAQVEVPASLKDAIAAEGEKKVFKRYLLSLGIEIQNEHRQKLQEKKPGERKRAGWLEEVVQ